MPKNEDIDMANILAIAQKGEPILNLVATPVPQYEFEGTWLTAFSQAMMDTMLERQGVGIAAPQVYVSKRVIIVASRPNLRYPDAPWMDAIVMVNPEIIEASKCQVLGQEGCLSVPEQRGEVARADEIRVKYANIQGESFEQTFTGFPARIIQHELDHLNGILFVDRI